MKAAAVIPAYNVESFIGEVVRRTAPYVESVVVVDDGSNDKTGRVAISEGATVISLEVNTGKANATRVGLQDCKGFEAVVTLDGDLQHCPEEIPTLLEGISEGADLCIGSRFLNSHYSMPIRNKISNKMASIILSLMAGQRISDPQSGFRALHKRAVQELELRAEGYAIEHIMILEAAKKNLTIKEVPISCVYGDETSQVRILQDTLRVTKDIMRFWLR